MILKFVPVCFSLECRFGIVACIERHGANKGVEKFVSRDTIDCPDCNHALFWHKLKSGESTYEESYYNALRGRCNSEKKALAIQKKSSKK